MGYISQYLLKPQKQVHRPYAVELLIDRRNVLELDHKTLQKM